MIGSGRSRRKGSDKNGRPLRRRLAGGALAWLATGLLVPCLGVAQTPEPAGASEETVDLPTADLPPGDLPVPYADPPRSLAWLATRLAADPGRIELHLAAARELTALGVTDSTHAQRVERLKQGEAEARTAIGLDSLSADAHYWLAAALGLLADEQGGLAKISAARGAYAETITALRLDPQHPGAHHILGRLHAGALRLSRVNRLIARGLGLGPILSSASWESAEEHMRVAAEKDPDRWVHMLELAKLLLRRDRRDEALVLLRDLAMRVPRDALDRHYQALARELLASS